MFRLALLFSYDVVLILIFNRSDDEGDHNTSSDGLLEDKILDTSIGSLSRVYVEERDRMSV